MLKGAQYRYCDAPLDASSDSLRRLPAGVSRSRVRGTVGVWTHPADVRLRRVQTRSASKHLKSAYERASSADAGALIAPQSNFYPAIFGISNRTKIYDCPLLNADTDNTR